jgi:hypothetical protein
MSNWDFITGVLGPVTRQFTAWMQRWVPGEDGATYAANSLATWLYDAACGQETSYGPYRMLYANGEWNLRQHDREMRGDVPFGIWRTIPIPSVTLLCDLTRAYSLINLATEYAQLSHPEMIHLYRLATVLRYDEQGNYRLPPMDPGLAGMPLILDRMETALDEHHRNCTGECADNVRLWHDEDNRSTRWLHRFLSESGDTFNGF